MDISLNKKRFSYPLTIKETHLDVFGHVNNAVYLTLFEEARWDFINKNGYDLKKMMETGLGPTILEVNLKFSREIRLRDEVIIESEMVLYRKKIGKLIQKIIRSGETCCVADFTFGLFDVNKRKLVLPTPEWLKAVGYEEG